MRDFDDDGGWYTDDDFCSECGSYRYRHSNIAGICTDCLSGVSVAENVMGDSHLLQEMDRVPR